MNALLHTLWAEFSNMVDRVLYGVITQGSPSATQAWSTIPIGGGGYVDGIDIAPDGTTIVRSDTPPSPYRLTGGSWHPLQTATSMPSAYVGTRNSVDILATGAWEIRIAPSLTTKYYMISINRAFVTTDSGTTWTELTSFPAQTDLNSNDQFRGYNYRMAVDPQNDAIVFVGTVSAGLQRSLDSGVTWSTRTVGSGAGTSGCGMLLAFDTTSSVVSGAQQGLFVARYGDGVYHSTDGGGTFTKLNTTGMPTTFSNMMVDQSGKLWVVDDNGPLWTWTSAAHWVQITIPFGAHSFDVDPTNVSRMAIAAGGGAIATSTDGGANWHSVYADNTITALDAPWQAMHYTGGVYFITDGKIRFDTQVAGKLWQAWGFGLMYAPNVFNSTTSIAFTTSVAGIEGIDATAITHPPGGNPVGASWDVPVWNFLSYTVAPSEYKPTSYNNGISPAAVTTSRGWAIDFAKSDPTFLVAITGYVDNGSGASGYSMYSSDSGVTWNYFASGTQSGTPFGGGGGYYGSVAVSTPSNFVVQNGNGLYYTTDGGATFHAATYAGSNGTYFIIPGKWVCADPNVTNKFYVSSPSDGIYASTDSGHNWSKISSFNPATFGFGQRFLGIPGHTGHLLLTGGYLDTGTPPQSGSRLYRSTDSGVTWASIANVGECWCMDYGTVVSGQSYPTIYFAGWADQGSGMTFGVWKTIDNFATFVQLGGTSHPMGWMSVINDIAGDKDIDGACSIAYFGGGYKTFR